jgi:cysteine-rich repeat protein
VYAHKRTIEARVSRRCVVAVRFPRCAALLAAILALCFASTAAADEVRGAWINPWTFTDAIRDQTLQKVRDANLNTLFVAVPPVGENQGWEEENWVLNADPAADFTAFVNAALADGFAVHGWIPNLHRRGSRTSNFRRDTEREAQRQWVLAILATYPQLDGIHLDFIRYKRWAKVKADKMGFVMETIRLIRDAIDGASPGRRLTATSFVAADANFQGRRDGDVLTWRGDIPQWFRDWYGVYPNNWYVVQSQTDPDLLPTWLLGPVHFNFQQNSPVWLADGLVDAVIPMQYTSDAQRWRDEADLWASFTDFLGAARERVIIGLGWLTEEGIPDRQHDPAAMVGHIQYGRTVGIGGVSVFELGFPGVDDQPLIDALTHDGEVNGFEAPFRDPAESWLHADVCGNGRVELGEGCDDGNLQDGDGCSSACTPEAP